MKKIIHLKDLGYNPLFESKNTEIEPKDCRPARVIAEYKQAYRVKNLQGEFLAKITGKIIFKATGREDYPAVGDWVMITITDPEQAVIKSILPRQTIIKRRFGDKNKIGEKSDVQIIATNIEVGFVIESVDRDYNLNRFERYFTILRDGGVKPVIILNKIDLISKDELDCKLAEIKNRFPDLDIILTSTVSSDGLGKLESYLQSGQTYCFLGSSGVGKSSLINKLIGEEIIKTGDISHQTNRGRHTTTGRQMYFLNNGAIVIDNPGIREIGLTDSESGVDSQFDEIISLGKGCPYTDCSHRHEPGCLVLEAVQSGKVDPEKYANYINLKKEIEYFDMSQKQRKEKEKDFGKFINKAKKELKDFGYENYQ